MLHPPWADCKARKSLDIRHLPNLASRQRLWKCCAIRGHKTQRPWDTAAGCIFSPSVQNAVPRKHNTRSLECSKRAAWGYKQDSRRALPIFVCVWEDQHELVAIYRIVVGKKRLRRPVWLKEAIVENNAETIVKPRIITSLNIRNSW